MSTSRKISGGQFESNIPKYFLYTALKGFSFGLFGAVWLIYLQQERGLSLSQAVLLDVTFFVSAALSEIPTGIIADTIGRKKSMVAGAALMSIGGLGWTFAPGLPLILLAYVAMGMGLTFLSGIEDALFYESVQLTGRRDEYTRLAGRAGATFLGSLALGSVASGLLASLMMILPFVASSLALLIMLGIILTFKEPRSNEKSDGQVRKPWRGVLRQAIALLRARPTLRYLMIYLALVPMASYLVEGVLLQPQAVALGVPIAGIGLIVMGIQLTNMVGSSLSMQIKSYFGEGQILYTAPVLIIFSLMGLAVFQIFSALLFIVVIGFFTSVIRPLLLSRIQNEVADDVRATLLSIQSLMFTGITAICQPILGFITEQSGLSGAYFSVMGSLSLVALFLVWKSRRYLSNPSYPQLISTPVLEAQQI